MTFKALASYFWISFYNTPNFANKTACIYFFSFQNTLFGKFNVSFTSNKRCAYKRFIRFNNGKTSKCKKAEIPGKMLELNFSCNMHIFFCPNSLQIFGKLYAAL